MGLGTLNAFWALRRRRTWFLVARRLLLPPLLLQRLMLAVVHQVVARLVAPNHLLRLHSLARYAPSWVNVLHLNSSRRIYPRTSLTLNPRFCAKLCVSLRGIVVFMGLLANGIVRFLLVGVVVGVVGILWGVLGRVVRGLVRVRKGRRLDNNRGRRLRLWYRHLYRRKRNQVVLDRRRKRHRGYRCRRVTDSLWNWTLKGKGNEVWRVRGNDSINCRDNESRRICYHLLIYRPSPLRSRSMA